MMLAFGFLFTIIFHSLHSKSSAYNICDGQRYNPKLQLCCDGNVVDNEDDLLMCCGKSGYNPDSHVCVPEDDLPEALRNRISQTARQMPPGYQQQKQQPDFSLGNSHATVDFNLPQQPTYQQPEPDYNTASNPNNFVRPTMVLTCQGTIVDSRLAQNSNLKCCGPLPYDSSVYMCSNGKLLPKIGPLLSSVNVTDDGTDFRNNPFVSFVADVMRHMNHAHEEEEMTTTTTTSTTTPVPTTTIPTTTTTTTTTKPTTTTEPRPKYPPPPVLGPMFPNIPTYHPNTPSRQQTGGRMRLNCDGQVYELIGLDEAVFYTCCGKQVYDTRRYSCRFNEVESLTTPLPLTPSTKPNALPRFISCEGSLWEVTDGNPFIECCGDRVYDKRFDTCSIPSSHRRHFAGYRGGRSLPPSRGRSFSPSMPQFDNMLPQQLMPDLFTTMNGQPRPRKQAPPPQPVCINGQLLPTTPGTSLPSHLACCMSFVYNTHSHFCCGGRLYDHRPDEMCCDGRYSQNYNGVLRCCGQNTFDPRIEMCALANPHGHQRSAPFMLPPFLEDEHDQPPLPLPNAMMYEEQPAPVQPPFIGPEPEPSLMQSPASGAYQQFAESTVSSTVTVESGSDVRPPGGVVESYWQRISGGFN